MSTLPISQQASLSGWGGYPSSKTDLFRPERMSDLPESLGQNRTIIPRGLGRSYGDASLNAQGLTVLMERLDRMLHFNASTGVLTCEAGVTIEDILRVFLPRGFMLPVTPGTQYVTVGGCLACDVHGKNHHEAGTFSQHILGFQILTAKRELVHCSRTENSELFWATAGGMGLTGLITDLQIKLKPVSSSFVSVDYQKARDLDEALTLFAESDESYEYSVAWIDCLARGRRSGRSVLMRGNDLVEEDSSPEKGKDGRRISVPFYLPSGLLNRFTVSLFNAVYYRIAPKKKFGSKVPVQSFFYPLDSVLNWNRIYGRKGFAQYQFVVPKETGPKALKAILEKVSEAGQASFLAVLKAMGPKADDHLLSFPREGFTLAIDIPWRGRSSTELLWSLDQVVLDHGGRVYLAKDSNLSRRTFEIMYPEAERWLQVKGKVDPNNLFRSDLSDRLGLTE